MKKIAIAVATVLAGGVISNVALADTYMGGKVGYNSLNDACYLNEPCDDDSFAASMHLGYSFNEYVAAEYGVDYLGDFTANFKKPGLNTVDGDLWALTLAPKFNLPLTDSWNLFAKVGAAYMIGSLDTTNWQQMGAPVGAQPGTIFTCTALCANPQNGYGWLVGTCVLKNQATPSVGNMNISMSISDSTPTYISKITNKFVQDFTGGETGGVANTGNVWNASQVVNDKEYAANFFTDESTFAKSGADVATWGTNGSVQNANGTLALGQVEKFTS